MSGRWPPRGPVATAAGRAPGHYDEEFAELRKAVGDLTAAITGLAPKVLGSRLVQLDANGQGAGNLRVPFQALAITSFSASTLTVTAAPLTGSTAPGPGPGVCQIPPRGFRVINERAHAWSIYGGTAGDLVYVEAFALPQPPAAYSPVLSVTASTTSVSDYPAGAVPLDAASGNVANAAAVATLAGAAGKTTWITGFEVTGTGSTAELTVLVTVAGPAVTMTYVYSFVVGATLLNAPLVVEFPKPIPAAAAATAIVVTLPAGGAGNTNAAVVAHGYQL